MATDTTKKLFNIDDLKRMDQAGILADNRVELIHGELFVMTPGARHASRVSRLAALLFEASGKRAMVSVQNPLRIDDYNLPQPDLMLLEPRDDFYETAHPQARNVYVVVEIADTSIERDRGVKLALYAIAGVQEYWVEDVREEIIHVYRDPIGDVYSMHLQYRRGDSLSPRVIPHLILKVSDILGG